MLRTYVPLFPFFEPQAQKPPLQPFAAQSEGQASEGEKAFEYISRWFISTEDVSASASASATQHIAKEGEQINDLFLMCAGHAHKAAPVTEGTLLIPSPPRPFLYLIPPHLQPYKIYFRTYVRTYVHNV